MKTNINFSTHGFKKKYRYIVCLFIVFLNFYAFGQCDNTLIGGAFGSATAPASGTVTISTCSYLQEYSTLNAVAAATTYQCAITTAPGGFITIRQGSSTGPVVAFGASPLTWSSSVAGTYFAHWNVNAACGLSTGCKTTTMTYVGPSTGCTGTPTGGITTANTVATTNGACVGQTLSLAVTGSTVASGLTYQWNYSANSGGPYTPIAGATSAGYSITYSAADAGFYVRDITCASSTSSSVEVGVTTNAPVACYCTTGLSTNGGSGDNITNVTIGAVNNTTSGNVAPYYTLYTTPVITLMQSTFEPISITFGPDGSQHSAVWIDFNQDGNFDASENVAISTVAAGGNASVTYSLAILSSGPLGLTRMRVRGGSDGPYASNGACLAYAWGETEDYVVDIVPNTLCSGTPTPGNTLATATSACPGQTVLLSLQNLTTGSGVTYQWVNNAGNIPGATNPTYTAIAGDDYYCNVTCGTNTGASVLITIGVNPFQNCYCSTNLHSFAGPCITQVDFNTLSNASTAACALPAYTAYPVSAATTIVYTGMTYNLTRQSSGTNAWTGIWIDYDHSGTFDASEYTQMSTTSTGTLSDVVAITIPTTALTGQTGMRIRQRAANMTAIDACTPNFGSGESEDYIIDIQVPPPCSGTPTPGNTIASATSVCPGTIVNFTLQFNTIGSGVSYQWFDGGGLITGATNQNYSKVITATDDYYCEVTCGSTTTQSTLVTINVLPAPIGSSMSNPIIVGEAPCASSAFVNIQTNTLANCFSNNYSGANNQTSPDIWYQVTLSAPKKVKVSHCASAFDTYVHILDASGTQLFFNDDNGPLCTGTRASIDTLLPAGTYFVVSEGFSTNTGSITTSISTDDSCATTLNLKCYIECYMENDSMMRPVRMYQGIGTSATDCDLISVDILDANKAIVKSLPAVMLKTDGTAICNFPPPAIPNGNYYIRIDHRTTVTTWSPLIPINSGIFNYDFSTAASQAYGSNQAQVSSSLPNRYALYSGDINKDCNIDLSDVAMLELANSLFLFGYLPEDVNGDGNINLDDFPCLEFKLGLFVFCMEP